MRRLLLGYLLWVVVPASFALGVVRARADRTEETRLLESGDRFGALAQDLLMDEMGALTGDLAREAPVLSDPDTTTPILRAAAQGDTVAALGTMAGELVLSVALAEGVEGGESQRIRAITETFSPEFPFAYSRALGYSTALYFRGQRVVAAPENYGPEALDNGGPQTPSQEPVLLEGPAWAGVLSPLGGGPASAPTLHALVGPSLPSPAPYGLSTSRLLLLLSCVLGACLLLVRGRRGGKDRSSGSFLLAAAFAVPMAVMWAGLLSHHGWMATETARFEEGELVRVHAVLRDLTPGIGPGALAQITGFGVTRVSQGGVESTLEAGATRAELLEIPPPTAGAPVTGVVGSGQTRLTYAAGLSPNGDLLILSIPEEAGGIPGWVLLAVLGSAANLLGLVFLLGERK